MTDKSDKSDTPETDEVHEVRALAPQFKDPFDILAAEKAANAGGPLDANKIISDATLLLERAARKADAAADAERRAARIREEENAARRRPRPAPVNTNVPEGVRPKSQPEDSDDKLKDQKQPPDRTKMDDFAVESAKPLAQKEEEKEEKAKIPSAQRVEKESKPN